MNRRTLVLRGLRHFRRTHAGVVAGAIVATATLVGALVVGDSVRFSLARRAQARIGRVDSVLASNDRFFRSALADELARELADAGAEIAPGIRIRGVAASSDGGRRVHDVQVLGVDKRFFALSPGAPGGSALEVPPDGEVYVNAELARLLALEVGGELVVRVEQPSALPRDMALAPDDVSVALRVRVARVLGNDEFGAFTLEAGTRPPATVVLSLDGLQGELDMVGRANLLLASHADEAAIEEALRVTWTLADAELDVRDAREGARELVTSRIFFDAPIVTALERVDDIALDGVFTYFVNEIRLGDRATPYSMVAALGAVGRELPVLGAERDRSWRSIVTPATGDGDIVLNRWIADDLGAAFGDTVRLSYYVVDASRKLVERSHGFRVGGIVPLAGPAADPTLMPDFPGLADSENCRDWEPGTPIDLDRIRDVDEEYWDDHHGTPKAFVTLDAGRELWSSRFGELTAVRFDADDEDAVRALLRGGLAPRELGLFFRDVRAGASGDSPTDFGGLFVGLSFFLIVAALLLATQLFLFGVEQRSREIGLLAAIGFRPADIRRLFLIEGLVLAAIGTSAGAFLGLGYTRAVLWGLSTVWRDAVSSTVLVFHASPVTVVLGALLSLAMTGATVWFTLRRKLAVPSYRLLAGDASSIDALDTAPTGIRSSKRARLIVAVGIAGALALVALVDPSSGPSAAGAFFGAGALFLTSAIILCRIGLQRLGAPGKKWGRAVRSIRALGVLGSTRRLGRSVATVALMAIGAFLVVAVGVNRQAATSDVTSRASGTGGFALFGRSSLPLVHDLKTESGRDAFGLDEDDLEGVELVPLRLRAGDDASCLNLARASNPVLLGVDSNALAERGAFTFASTSTPGRGWELLDDDLDDGAIPAIGDAISLQWQLHKSVGDTIDYTDERGRSFSVRIVGAIADSILQGNLLIAERRFEELFPTDGGYRRFLLDVPPARTGDVEVVLSRALSDIGLSLERTGARLDTFHAVQNTYLAIFEALGALGLLLGSVGLGMVVLRNTLERRSELALVSAIGFSRRVIRRWVFSEYGFLLALGLGAGALSALVAILPAMRGPGSELSLTNLARLFAIVAANGVLWIALASRVATRRTPVSALCDE